MSSALSSVAGGRTRACDACRKLKLRCDAHKFDYDSCSRCRRLKRECVLSKNVKKRNRATKAELEDELDKLREQVAHPGGGYDSVGSVSPRTAPTSVPQVNFGAPIGNGPTSQPAWSDIPYAAGFSSMPPPIPMTDISSTMNSNKSSAWTSPQNFNAYQSPSMSQSLDSKSVPAQSPRNFKNSLPTTPRAVGDIDVSTQKIRDCFALFFEHYAPAFPGIYENDRDPDTVWEKNKFLFWAITQIGSRRYRQDPSLVECLAKPLTEMAHRYLLDPEHGISSIRAALALCMWPLPISSTWMDPSHAMAGAALQLGIQKGLPFASRKQDFSNVALQNVDKDRLFRSRLWIYCQMVAQSTNMLDGLPCIPAINTTQTYQDGAIFDGLRLTAPYEYRLHGCLVDAATMIVQTIDLVDLKDSHLLRSMIEHFDGQARHIRMPDTEDWSKFLLNSVRLAIGSYHFFSEPDTARDAGVLQTYNIATDLIDVASRLDELNNFAYYCSLAQARTVSLAGFVVLRAHRSSLSLMLDRENGEKTLTKGINFAKKRMLRGNDLDDRTSIILAHLWSSSKVFKYKDGSVDGLRLLLRGRLHMSVIFDALWWWRSEFGGSLHPYVPSDPSPKAIAMTSVSDNKDAEMEVLPLIEQNFGAGAFNDGTFDYNQVPNWLLNFSDMPSGWQWDPCFSWPAVQ